MPRCHGVASLGPFRSKSGFNRCATRADSSPDLLTVREAAKRLRVSTATVYRTVYWMREVGKLAHARVWNAIRISPADLQVFLAKGAQ
jgi:excisionase family DNA binding protein